MLRPAFTSGPMTVHRSSRMELWNSSMMRSTSSASVEALFGVLKGLVLSNGSYAMKDTTDTNHRVKRNDSHRMEEVTDALCAHGRAPAGDVLRRPAGGRPAR